MPIEFPSSPTPGMTYTPPGIPGVKYTYNDAKKVWVGAVASSSAPSYTLTPATNLALGGVKVSTGLDVQSDGTLSVKPNQSLLSANGYTYIGGLLMQWGYVASVPADGYAAVTFYKEFPAAVFSVVASLVNTNSPSSYSALNNIVQVGVITTSGFHLINNLESFGPIMPAYWLAVGN
jgi:hypothetical protein